MLILCAGMIRSGSTLQYNLARALAEEHDVGRGEGFLENLCEEDTQTRVRCWLHDDLVHVVKTHRPSATVLSPGGNGIRVLYIYRDLRDVAVSLQAKDVRRSFGDIMRNLEDAVDAYRHVRELSPLLCQRYEDLIADVPQAVQQIAEFVGIRLDQAGARAIAEQCSISLAREETSRLGFKLAVLSRKAVLRLGVARAVADRIAFLPGYSRRTLLKENHISRNSGAVGSWRSHLPPDRLRRIEQEFGSWLRETGYAASGRPSDTLRPT